jgi:hypothetical protein
MQLFLALPADADLRAVGALVVKHQVGRGLSAGFAADSEEGLLEPGELLHLVEPWKECHCGHGPDSFDGVVKDALRTGATSSIGALAVWPEDERFSVHTKRKRKLIDPIERVSIASENFAEAQEEKILYVARKDIPRRTVIHRHGRRRKTSH